LFAFGVQSLTRALNQNGFRVTRVGTWSLEQNPFGFIQSWLNQRGYPRDRAYSTLKGLKSSNTRAQDLLMVSLLTIPALVHSIAEAIARKGATMTIVAKPNA
jgi:hypothetical protein